MSKLLGTRTNNFERLRAPSPILASFKASRQSSADAACRARMSAPAPLLQFEEISDE